MMTVDQHIMIGQCIEQVVDRLDSLTKFGIEPDGQRFYAENTLTLDGQKYKIVITKAE